MPAKRLTERKKRMRHTYSDTTLMRPSTARAMRAALRHLGDDVMMGSIVYEDRGWPFRDVRVTGLDRSIWDRSTLIRYIVLIEATAYVGSELTVAELDWLCQEDVFNTLLELLSNYQRQQVTTWPPDRYDSIAPVRFARQWAYRVALARIGNAALLAAFGARIRSLIKPEGFVIDNTDPA